MEAATKADNRSPAKIKICGLRREEDIRIINELKPEYVGFVFYEKSKRNVTEEQAERFRNMLFRDIISVGVFVDADLEKVARLLGKGVISIAQLHGHESGEYIKELRRMVTLNSENDRSFSSFNPVMKSPTRRHSPKIIKAFLVRGEEDIRQAEKSTADYILFDQGLGSGETFDWDMAQELLRDFPKPYFLAGGLDENNVREAIEKLHPYVVDISSKVETEGFKDREKIKAFIDAVRR